MQLKIPFLYHGLALAPGKRKPARTPFAGEVEVALAEARPEDCVLVAEWTQRDRYTDETDRHEVRLHGGRLYRPCLRFDDSTCEYVGVRPDEISAADIPGAMDYEDARKLARHLEGHALAPPETFRNVEESDREDMHRRLLDAISGYLVVGGKLWEPACAPTVVLDVHRPGSGLCADAEVFTDRHQLARFLHSARSCRADTTLVIGGGRLDILADIAARTAPKSSPFLPVFTVDAVPADLCEPDFEMDLACAATSALDRHGEELMTYSDTAIGAWVALRASVGELAQAEEDGDLDDAHVEGVMMAWEAFCSERQLEVPAVLSLYREVWDARGVTVDVVPPGTALEGCAPRG